MDKSSLLVYGLVKHPEKIGIKDLRGVVAGSGRKNDKREAWVKLSVPDDVVKALRGPRELAESDYVLVAIPREVKERAESRIILPDEV